MGGHAKNKEANGGTNYAFPYMRKAVNRSFLERVKWAVWNPEERTFLGRTAKRWGVIGLIYLIMYICIIVFFSLCMCGLMATIDPRVPRYKLAESIIGKNPGLGHRPLFYEEGTLIWYTAGNETQVKKYVDNLKDFLAPYKNKTLLPNKGENQMQCDRSRPPENASCAVDVTKLGDCTEENNFGYSNATPCIFIKLNKIYDWVPEYYDDPDHLPADMSDDLKSYINSTNSKEERQQVWMSCFGERPVDNEHIGPLKYYPQPGLPSNYFPYRNVPGYLSPLVAVQFLNPTRNRIINIRCRAWASNVVYANSLGWARDRLGSTHIEIMID